MKRVKVYVEGATRGRAAKQTVNIEFRRAFHKFAERLGLERLPEFVPCGGRAQTWEIAYQKYLQRDDDEIVMLLVDSEETSRHLPPEAWQHLRERAEDGWNLDPRHKRYVFMMVVTMETWLIADINGLALYFGQGFRPEKIPAWPDLEAVSKETVMEALEAATAGTAKPYAKGERSFEAFAALDPDRVAARCPHAARFVVRLRSVCGAR